MFYEIMILALSVGIVIGCFIFTYGFLVCREYIPYAICDIFLYIITWLYSYQVLLNFYLYWFLVYGNM